MLINNLNIQILSAVIPFVLLMHGTAVFGKSFASNSVNLGSDSISVVSTQKKITYVNSQISTRLLAKSYSQQLPKKENLLSVEFSDQENGWITGETAIYTTNDGGKTWQRRLLELPDEAKIFSAYFENSMVGWVVLERSPESLIQFEQRHFWLMKSNDGGKTWSLQLEKGSADLSEAVFSNTQGFWLVGSKYLGLYPLRFAPLVLFSTDKGEHWQDLSQIFSESKAESPNLRKDEGIISLISDPTFGVALVTFVKNSIYYRDISTGAWQMEAPFVAEPFPLFIDRIGFDKAGNTWLVGGQDSIEGIGSDFIVKQSNASWIQYGILDINITDIQLIGDNKVLGCGTQAVGDRGKRYGVLLYSSDKGNSWVIIYRNKQITRINALYHVNSNRVWAVGENGTIIRIALPKD